MKKILIVSAILACGFLLNAQVTLKDITLGGKYTGPTEIKTTVADLPGTLYITHDDNNMVYRLIFKAPRSRSNFWESVEANYKINFKVDEPNKKVESDLIRGPKTTINNGIAFRDSCTFEIVVSSTSQSVYQDGEANTRYSSSTYFGITHNVLEKKYEDSEAAKRGSKDF